ncbi:MAG: murein biosynthesis integral membrane protein MurJ [Thermomicrobiales bacterium]
MSQATQVFGDRRRVVPVEEPARPSSSVGRAAPNMARSALIVGLAFVLSRVLGVAREVILARTFATGPEMDAYVSAFRIPDLLFLTVFSGAFGAAFIPIFGEFVDRGDRDRAWRLASAVLTWSGIAVVILSTIMFVAARPLMHLVSPGFDAQTMDIAVRLMRILLLSPVFLGLGIAAKGILEAQNQFTLPAIAPLVYNLGTIVGAAFFAPKYGIYAVAWGLVVGALGHFLTQVPGLIRTGISFRPTIDRNVDGLREVARLFGPRVLGLAAFQINLVAVTAFASISGPSDVAAVNYSQQLLMLPHGVLALSISTVAFPSLAALFSRGDTAGFRNLLDRTMRPLLFLTFPASAGLLLVREPIVQVIYERGNFGPADTALVIAPLAFFAIGLVGYGLTEIVTRVFYATRDTRTPVITTILTVGLNIVLCGLFVHSLGAAGLALALSLTTASEAVILLLFLRHRIGSIVSPDFWPWLAKVIAATAGMALVIMATVGRLERAMIFAPSSIMRYGIFLFAMAMYLLAFLVCAQVLRISELETVTDKIVSRLPGPLARIARTFGFGTPIT